jgi:hypothetical protein
MIEHGRDPAGPGLSTARKTEEEEDEDGDGRGQDFSHEVSQAMYRREHESFPIV